ncbi:MAG: hypothetical protein MNPFHGCM_01927 [Gemmatimonadaceae bacterium]|nr:hypothetical protein [Gemmatimonadaceae bacterium]
MRAQMSSFGFTVLVLVAGLAAGCGAPSTVASGPPATTTVSLDREFELAPGQKAFLSPSGLTIRFDSVANDSRCPVDVVCVWSGNAAVHVTIQRPGEAAHEATLDSTVGEKSARNGTETVTLVSLRPEPDTRRPFTPGDYRARFIVRNGE